MSLSFDSDYILAQNYITVPISSVVDAPYLLNAASPLFRRGHPVPPGSIVHCDVAHALGLPRSAGGSVTARLQAVNLLNTHDLTERFGTNTADAPLRAVNPRPGDVLQPKFGAVECRGLVYAGGATLIVMGGRAACKAQ